MGGGALTTPFLILGLGLNPVLAIGTDLVFAAVTKIVGGIRHWRQDNVAPGLVLWMALGSLPATVVGAQILLSSSQNSQFVQVGLPKLLGVTLIGVALILLYRQFWGPAGQEAHDSNAPRVGTIVLIGVCGGLLVGMTSVGGGTVIMVLLIIFCTIPVQQMIGLDVMHGALLTTTARFSS